MREIIREIKQQLDSLCHNSDLSELGNVIGITIAKHQEKDKLGFEIEDFNSGFHHGVSLIDGTHGGGNNDRA